MRILAGVFVICTVAAGACAFDTSGSPSSGPSGGGDVDAAIVTAPPDAAPPPSVSDARPSPPDACAGPKCDGDKGPGH